MDVTNTVIRNNIFSSVIDLTSNIDRSNSPLYSLYKVDLKDDEASKNLEVETNQISLFVISGKIKINPTNGKSFEVDQENGIHIKKGSCFSVDSLLPNTSFFIASSAPLAFNLATLIDTEFNSLPLDTYKVDKPWGWEQWYTNNCDDDYCRYALKMIFMKKGNQSSLQSHEQKSETNIVIQGEALVLYGVEAPADHSHVIDLSTLRKKTYRPGTGWSNKVRELHRVIASEDYKAIEVSTTELDDVVRWADDSNRPSGRIESEHKR